jgi:anaerobic dimethyl sulfoxide reductase subunit B (iron-sulfur subunit)
MDARLGFHLDASACIGCRTCVIACKSKNGLPAGRTYRRVVEFGGGSWIPDPEDPTLLAPSGLFAYCLSIACMHCQDPACVAACPTEAIQQRSDGVVLIDSARCAGCRYCEWACPYGALSFDSSTGRMTKCDMCVDLVDAGEVPWCVSSCVTRALEMGPIDDLRAEYGGLDALAPLPAGTQTRPSLVITPHRHGQPAGQGTGRSSNPERDLR